MKTAELQELKDDLKEHLESVIQEKVNGKIEKMQNNLNEHNQKHEEDMKKILPIIEAYETTQNGGRFVLKTAGVITILGSAYLMVKHIIK